MTDSSAAWWLAGGLIVGFGVVPLIVGEIRFWRVMKAEAERERAERRRQAAQERLDLADVYKVPWALMEWNTPLIDRAVPLPAAAPPPPLPSPVPPTLDVLAATAQQNPERWKDFLDV